MKLEEITLEWLQARVIERDGCWIWNGTYGRNKDLPQARVDYKLYPAQRLIWIIVHEKEVPKGFRVGSNCENQFCCHPDHVQAKKPGTALKGRKLPIAHKMKIAKTKRAMSSLSDVSVKEIRSSERPREELAKEHGIDLSYVGYIKSGRSRKDYSSPFAGLGA